MMPLTKTSVSKMHTLCRDMSFCQEPYIALVPVLHRSTMVNAHHDNT